MSDSDTQSVDLDDLSDLPELASKMNLPKYPQVSGFDDDTEGIEAERNPDDDPSKEMLEAAENGKVDAIVRLVSEDRSLVQAADKDGYTPLHRASYNNHTNVIKLLLDYGGDVSAKTIDDWQPLHSACKWNSLKSAEMLILYGADVNAISKGGVTPLHLASGNAEAIPLVQLLLSHPLMLPFLKDHSGDTAADIACRTGPNAYLFEPHDSCFR